MTEPIDHYAEALARLDLLPRARFDAEVLGLGLSSIVDAILALREVLLALREVLIAPEPPNGGVYVPVEEEEFTEPPAAIHRGMESFGRP